MPNFNDPSPKIFLNPTPLSGILSRLVYAPKWNVVRNTFLADSSRKRNLKNYLNNFWLFTLDLASENMRKWHILLDENFKIISDFFFSFFLFTKLTIELIKMTGNCLQDFLYIIKFQKKKWLKKFSFDWKMASNTSIVGPFLTMCTQVSQ